MKNGIAPQDTERMGRLWTVAAIVLFVLAIHGVWWALGDKTVAGGGFADGDSFTRLIRVQQLVDTGDWYDNTIPKANAPFGTSVHWTRPLDVLLIAVALPVSVFVDWADALHFSGVVISPLLHAILAVSVVWAMAPVIGFRAAAAAGALTATQFGILSFSIIGHADHHLLFPVLIVVSIGFMARSFEDENGGMRFAFLAGSAVAAANWVGQETIIFLALCLTVTGFAWLRSSIGGARRNAGFVLGLAATQALTLAAERGFRGFTQVEYDRISIEGLNLAVLLSLFWLAVGISRIAADSPAWGKRLAVAAVGAGLIAAIHLALFPKAFTDPFLDTDPAILPIYAHISEYGPIDSFGRFLLYLGALVFAAPWLRLRLKSGWDEPGGRWIWLLITLAILAYSAFTVGWVRWSLYTALFLAIVVGDLAVRTDGAIDARFPFPKRTLIKVPVILLLAVGPMIAGTAVIYAETSDEERQQNDADRCPLPSITAVLNQSPWSDRPRTIVASANFGAELMYRTPHDVVATVHHRNVAGILAGHRLLRAVSDDRIRPILKERDVDLILLCPESRNEAYIRSGADPQSLYHRLVDGSTPAWLRTVPLPDEAAARFKLFKVTAQP